MTRMCVGSKQEFKATNMHWPKKINIQGSTKNKPLANHHITRSLLKRV